MTDIVGIAALIAALAAVISTIANLYICAKLHQAIRVVHLSHRRETNSSNGP